MPEDLAVLGGGQRAVVDDAAAVDRGHVVLLALLDPLHGPAGPLRRAPARAPPRRRRSASSRTRRRRPARSRGASTRGCPHDARQRHLRDVRDLGRAPQRELALRRDRHTPGSHAARSRWGSGAAGRSAPSRRPAPMSKIDWSPPPPWLQCTTVFLPSSSWITGAPSAIASSQVDDRRQRGRSRPRRPRRRPSPAHASPRARRRRRRPRTGPCPS